MPLATAPPPRDLALSYEGDDVEDEFGGDYAEFQFEQEEDQPSDPSVKPSVYTPMQPGFSLLPIGDFETSRVSSLLNEARKIVDLESLFRAKSLDFSSLLDHVKFIVASHVDLIVQHHHVEFFNETKVVLDEDVALRYLAIFSQLCAYNTSASEYYDDRIGYWHAKSELPQIQYALITKLFGQRSNRRLFEPCPRIKAFEMAAEEAFAPALKLCGMRSVGIDDMHEQMGSKEAKFDGLSTTKVDAKARPFGYTIHVGMTSLGILTCIVVHMMKRDVPKTIVERMIKAAKNCALQPALIRVALDRGYGAAKKLFHGAGFQILGTDMKAYNQHRNTHSIIQAKLTAANRISYGTRVIGDISTPFQDFVEESFPGTYLRPCTTWLAQTATARLFSCP